MKKLALICVLVILTSASYANNLEGTYSIDSNIMNCTGSWSHPFIPMGGKINHGTPDGAIVDNTFSRLNLSFRDNKVTLTTTDLRERTKTITLTTGNNKNVNLKLTSDKMILTQKRFLQSNWDYSLYLGTTIYQKFHAILSSADNGDLVLENYSKTGFSKSKLKMKCILPRL